MYRALVDAAAAVTTQSYSPYSNFKVGAALLTQSGKIYTGGNIENASYSATICAERVAFVKALSDGEREFSAIAVMSSDNKECVPCGVCLQFMSEFVQGDFAVVLGSTTDYTVRHFSELMPQAFKR